MRFNGFYSALSGRLVRHTHPRRILSTRVPTLRDAYTTSSATQQREIKPLEQIILSSIKATGPISVSNYMQLCLGYPTHGYYMKGDPLGVAGDFITSPEITQVFGELTAIWFISALQATVPLSSPPSGGGIRKLRLVELGPGRGTLSSDILRVLTGPLASRSGLPPVTNVHLVETSLALRAKQERILEQYTHNASSTTSSGSIDPLSIEWHDHIDDVPVDVGPETHTLVVANEFFDALPINVFEKAADGWREVLVDENTQSNVLRPSEVPVSSRTDTSSTSIASTLHSPPRLRFIVSNQPLPVPALATNPRFLNLPVGTRVEYSRGGVGTMRSLARLIGGSGSGGGRGLGLIIDYGDDRFFSSSFRGIRNHRIVDPFDQPGNSDLTANVDFATLKDAIGDVTNVCVHGPISQAKFLYSMGLEARVAGLLRGGGGDADARMRIVESAKKLVDEGPVGMGKTFRVMALSSSSTTTTTTTRKGTASSATGDHGPGGSDGTPVLSSSFESSASGVAASATASSLYPF